MEITGAEWCDFVVFTKKGMSVEKIAFNCHYWSDLERKLLLYYYENFIAVLKFKCYAANHRVCTDKVSLLSF